VTAFLTVVVDLSVVVLVSVLHELLDVVFGDRLAGGLQHQLQLLQVDVAVGVPARRRAGTPNPS